MAKAASNVLFECAQQLLAAADEALQDSLQGPIERKQIWTGVPAFDCAPSLNVSMGGLGVADTLPGTPALAPMQRIVTTGMVDIQVMAVTTLRCVATIGQDGQVPVFPPPSHITADAQDVYSDAWAIWNGLKNRHKRPFDGSQGPALFQDRGGRREFSLDPIILVNNQGGFGGSIINVRFQVPGYNEDAP